MVMHSVCGATKALIRQNANHMGWQVGHWCGLWSQRKRTTGLHPSVLLVPPADFSSHKKVKVSIVLIMSDNVWIKHLL